MQMDILMRMWLMDCGARMIACVVLLAAFGIAFLAQKMRRPDWASMSKAERKRTKKKLRKSGPEPWLIPAVIVILCWTIADSLPYFRDMIGLQTVRTEAEVVSLYRYRTSRRTRYYVCTVNCAGQESELKLSLAQMEESEPEAGESYAFSYFPHSGTVIEVESVDKECRRPALQAADPRDGFARPLFLYSI